jgi:hypothetical protein
MRTSDIPTISGEFPSGTQVLALVEVEPGVKRMRLGPVPVGPEGTIGPQGPQGPQGIQGEHGHIGAVGPQGPQGIQGVQGPQGEQGATGATGPAGMGFTIRGEWNGTDEYYVDDVVTVDGSSYGSLADGNVNHAVTDYTWWCLLASGGVQGPQGIQGVQGVQGAAGAAGAAGADGPQGTQNANLVYAGPASGSAATPGFRALIAADLPAARECLTASRTYYVATTGSDTADGLSANTPFLTLAKALAVATSKDILAGFAITIQLADGTYSQASTLELPPTIVCGKITIQGNTTTPANVVVNSSAAVGVVIRASQPTCDYVLRSFRVASAHAAGLVVARYGARLTIRGIEFGTTTGTHLSAQMRGFITISEGYSIVGSGFVHLAVDIGSVLEFGSFTVTSVGSPAFTIFAYASNASILYTGSVVYSGTVTGKRYYAEVGGILNTNGGGSNYFPGNSAGSVSTGGQYI